MNHKVIGVQNLHNSAISLYGDCVLSGENSADSILRNLNSGIENLKANWRGRDAGLRIQEVIKVHNAMINVRNALAQLAVDSTKVAHNYRKIQIANGAGLDELNILNCEDKTKLSDYSDTADTVDINQAAEAGKASIDRANAALEVFIVNVKQRYDEIMENWTAGTGRDNAKAAFDNFVSNANRYRETLSGVSSNITKALQNYKF